MLCMETTAVCCESHTRPINTLCGQNAEFLMLNLAVVKQTLGFEGALTSVTAQDTSRLLLRECRILRSCDRAS
jgi:hypothetical protein